MTLQEKAKRLVREMQEYHTADTAGFERAKNCALIAIREMKDVARFADEEVKEIVNGLEDEIYKL